MADFSLPTSKNKFSKINDQGLPILNKKALDKVLSKYHRDSLTASQYRSNYNAFGWNVKSDSSFVSHGPAIFGIEMGTIPSMSGANTDIVKAGTQSAATDADFKKAAEKVGIDANSYIKPVKFVAQSGGMGTSEARTAKNSSQYTNPITGETYVARIDKNGNFLTELDKKSLYNQINNQTKDLYLVGNALNFKGHDKPSDHAAILFKNDGSGNLIPITKEDGSIAYTPYKGSTVHHGGASEQFAELAMPLAMAAMIVAPEVAPYLSGLEVAAAVPATAFTVGAPALTLGSVIGATGVAALSGTLINVGMAAITGGDIGKAALTGAISGGIGANVNSISESLFSADSIKAIAKATNLNPDQVKSIIARGVSTTINSGITDPKNLSTNLVASVASGFASSSAKNLITNNINGEKVSAFSKAVGSAAGIATDALVKGKDVGKALSDNAVKIGAEAVRDLKNSNKTDVKTNPKTDVKTVDNIEWDKLTPGQKDYLASSTAALVGSNIDGQPVTPGGLSQAQANDPKLFEGGNIRLGADQTAGELYTVKNKDGEIFQARDVVDGNGNRFTAYFDPKTKDYGQGPTTYADKTLADNGTTGSNTPSIHETKDNILDAITDTNKSEVELLPPEEDTTKTGALSFIDNPASKVTHTHDGWKDTTPDNGITGLGNERIDTNAKTAVGAEDNSPLDSINNQELNAGKPGDNQELNTVKPGLGLVDNPSTSTKSTGVTGLNNSRVDTKAKTAVGAEDNSPLDSINNQEPVIDKTSPNLITNPILDKTPTGSTGLNNPRIPTTPKITTPVNNPKTDTNNTSNILNLGLPTFLDSTAEFLNSKNKSGKKSQLKSVNKEAEKDVQSLDNESDSSQGNPMPNETNETAIGLLGYKDAGSVDLTQTIKDWTNAFCTKKSDPQFSKICDKPEFNYSGKSIESHKLKPLRQTRINPLATGGLPHKYTAAAPKGHKPEFITGMTGYYACGAGTGQSDDIPAMLHDGDYVMDAETVSALGDGSSKAGHHVLEGFRTQIPHKKEGGSNPVPAKIADGEYVFPSAFVTALGGGDNKRGAEILDGLRTKLRAHKRGAPLDKIPPKAKDPIEYIKAGSK